MDCKAPSPDDRQHWRFEVVAVLMCRHLRDSYIGDGALKLFSSDKLSVGYATLGSSSVSQQQLICLVC